MPLPPTTPAKMVRKLYQICASAAWGQTPPFPLRGNAEEQKSRGELGRCPRLQGGLEDVSFSSSPELCFSASLRCAAGGCSCSAEPHNSSRRCATSMMKPRLSVQSNSDGLLSDSDGQQSQNA